MKCNHKIKQDDLKLSNEKGKNVMQPNYEKVRSYQDLLAWKKARELQAEVANLIDLLPKCEMYALSDQIRRATVSISSNIVEGYGRESAKSYRHFLRIARGSLNEAENQLLICLDFNYLTREQIEHALSLFKDTGRLLNGLISSLDKKIEEQEKAKRKKKLQNS